MERQPNVDWNSISSAASAVKALASLFAKTWLTEKTGKVHKQRKNGYSSGKSSSSSGEEAHQSQIMWCRRIGRRRCRSINSQECFPSSQTALASVSQPASSVSLFFPFNQSNLQTDNADKKRLLMLPMRVRQTGTSVSARPGAGSAFLWTFEVWALVLVACPQHTSKCEQPFSSNVRRRWFHRLLNALSMIKQKTTTAVCVEGPSNAGHDKPNEEK